ncbi:MAG: thiamine ABC transporter substrate-binding protein [Anaerolineales bacterium]
MRRFLALLSILMAALTSCGPAATGPGQPTEQPVLSVMTHDSFEVSEAVVSAFEREHNVDVQFLKSGDAGSALNKAILSVDNPLADVFYGVDNTFLSRALAEDIFVPYDSPALDDVPDVFELDPEHRALPVDYGDVCLNYDKASLADAGVEPPASLTSLLEPAYQDMLVVENPATSSPGLAFLLATIGRFGADGYLDYWQGLVDNGVKVVNDWDTAYYSEFTISGGGRPIVVSYGSSPPAEVYFAEQTPDSAPTGVVTADRSCFRQIEFAGILRNGAHKDLAEAWIDYMLSPAFQEDMPLNMFVYPVNQTASLPSVFSEYTVIPDQTAEVSPQEVASNREAWIDAWTETVLR